VNGGREGWSDLSDGGRDLREWQRERIKGVAA
jgi:hypothetical protein